MVRSVISYYIKYRKNHKKIKLHEIKTISNQPIRKSTVYDLYRAPSALLQNTHTPSPSLIVVPANICIGCVYFEEEPRHLLTRCILRRRKSRYNAENLSHDNMEVYVLYSVCYYVETF